MADEQELEIASSVAQVMDRTAEIIAAFASRENTSKEGIVAMIPKVAEALVQAENALLFPKDS